MSEIPEVRHFVACEDIAVSPGGQHHTLVNVFQSLHPRPGDAFPLLHARTCLYAILTNGLGVHTFAVELTVGVPETVIGASAPRPMDLGQDPLVVHAIPLRLPRCGLTTPGSTSSNCFATGR